MLGAQAGDPTARTGPRAGAGNLWHVDVAVFLKVVVQPSESSEEFALPTFSTGRGLRLGIAVGRDESHPDGLRCCYLIIRQLAPAVLRPQAGDPQSDPPGEPFFMSFGVRVAVLPGVGG